MLRALGIRNFVIAERVELEVEGGFTVLTGETGAGKSILVDAIELLVGGRGDAALVREGADRAELQAEFDLEAGGPLAAWLVESGLEGDPGALLLRRTIDRQGRTRCFINGHAATLAQLAQAGESLVDIHGQHAHQSLLRAAGQRDLLDAFAGAEALAAETGGAYRDWQRLERLADDAEKQFAQREAERSDLAAQVSELARLAPREGEWGDLEAAHRRLAHGSSLLAGAQSALETLSEAEGACLPQLAAVASRLASLAEHDGGLRPIAELLQSAQAQAGEAARELRAYASRVELDPEALLETERRIEVLHTAARKQRVRPETLAQRLAQLRERLAELELAASPEALQREVAASLARYDSLADQLSVKRKAGAQRLSRAVSAQMQGLAMKGGRFAVALESLDAPAAAGREQAVFQVSAHPSLPLRPLAKVASGGELSRLSLAIQLVASRMSPVGTLVFDEVDAGIGGAVADAVGRALKRIGGDRQVLCVTHLPQVAAQGDHHWSVSRRTSGGQIATAVQRLAADSRVEELARMLGGQGITETTRRHAAELLRGG
ncbi:MAG: DNA repair protein RecN [Betaproteobacteria bacterium RIFCSPLOWO2_02_FULL_66_14]|nr:MAG: DNA repair protein RecN [Betaproteobacteria bacterium RIFCSPLOWO2_02_FULL_66_14]